MEETSARRVGTLSSWDDVAFVNEIALSSAPYIMLDNSDMIDDRMMVESLEFIHNLQAASPIISHPNAITLTAPPLQGFGLSVDSLLEDTGGVRQAIPNNYSFPDQLVGNDHRCSSSRLAEAGNVDVLQRSSERENFTPLQEHLHTIYAMAGFQSERENVDLSTQLKKTATDNVQPASRACNRIKELAEGNSTARLMRPQAILPTPSNDQTFGCTSQTNNQKRRVRARRGQATDQHSIAERQRRTRITERMNELQQLVPNSRKMDKASMLDEITQYVGLLQLRLKCACMRKVEGGNTVMEWRSGVAERNVRTLLDRGDVQEALQFLGRQGVGVVPISMVKSLNA